MSAKLIKAYVSEPTDIKALIQKAIENAAKNSLPLGVFAATAEHPLQELHLGKVMQRVLSETNSRQQGLGWLVRHAAENRYFVLLNADREYLDGLAQKFYDAFELQKLRVSHSLMVVQEKSTPEKMSEDVYGNLCAATTPLQEAQFTL